MKILSNTLLLLTLVLLSSCNSNDNSKTYNNARKKLESINNTTVKLSNKSKDKSEPFEPYDKYCGKIYTFKLSGNKCLVIRKATPTESENQKYTHFGNYTNDDGSSECYFNINELNL